jgi:hypothetical protein
MQKGDGSCSLKKHRQGIKGKKANPPSGLMKILNAIFHNRSEAELEKLREAKKKLQGFVSIEEWLSRRGR